MSCYLFEKRALWVQILHNLQTVRSKISLGTMQGWLSSLFPVNHVPLLYCFVKWCINWLTLILPVCFCSENIVCLLHLLYILEDFENAFPYFCTFLANRICDWKLLADFNLQPKIGMNQSVIWLHYHATLLMTSHGYIQHPAPFCTVSWSFLIIFVFKLWCVWYHISNWVYRLVLIKSNWLLQYFENKRQI